MHDLSESVGVDRPNRAADVKLVQQLLNNHIKALAPMAPLAVTGKVDEATIAAIRAFQAKVVGLSKPDGAIDRGGKTIKALSTDAPASPPDPGDQSAINNAAIDAAAQKIGCERAAVKAVTMTEVGIRGPFDAMGRATILFERHLFHKWTKGRFDAAHPDISNPSGGGYGKFSAQYPKLERAMALDRSAALKSASWGAFQILGENHKAAGYASVEDFVAASKTSLAKQIEGFGNFVVADPRLRKALQVRDWTTFARIYNGPGYRKNNYDVKMRQNYEILGSKP